MVYQTYGRPHGYDELEFKLNDTRFKSNEDELELIRFTNGNNFISIIDGADEMELFSYANSPISSCFSEFIPGVTHFDYSDESPFVESINLSRSYPSGFYFKVSRLEDAFPERIKISGLKNCLKDGYETLEDEIIFRRMTNINDNNFPIINWESDIVISYLPEAYLEDESGDDLIHWPGDSFNAPILYLANKQKKWCFKICDVDEVIKDEFIINTNFAQHRLMLLTNYSLFGNYYQTNYNVTSNEGDDCYDPDPINPNATYYGTFMPIKDKKTDIKVSRV